MDEFEQEEHALLAKVYGLIDRANKMMKSQSEAKSKGQDETRPQRMYMEAHSLLEEYCRKTCHRRAQPIFVLEEMNFARQGMSEAQVKQMRSKCATSAEEGEEGGVSAAIQLQLGHAYRFGNGTNRKNVNQAHIYYRQAFDQSKDTDNAEGIHGAAAYALAWLLNADSDQMHSDTLCESVELFTLAHSLGHPCAAYGIYYSLHYGNGVTKSDEASQPWLTTAIENGYAFAMGIKAENIIQSIDFHGDAASLPGERLLLALNLMRQAASLRFGRSAVKPHIVDALRGWLCGRFDPADGNDRLGQRFRWFPADVRQRVRVWLLVNHRRRLLMRELALMVIVYICAAPLAELTADKHVVLSPDSDSDSEDTYD